MDMSWPCCGGIIPLSCGGGGGGGDNERVAEKEEREPPSPPPPLPLVPSPPLLRLPPGRKPCGKSSSSSSLAFVAAPRFVSVTGRGVLRHRGSSSTVCISRNAVAVSCVVVVVALQFDWPSSSVAPSQSTEEAPSLLPLFLPALLDFLLLLLPPLLFPGVGMARSLTDRSRDAVRIQGGSSITFCVKYHERTTRPEKRKSVRVSPSLIPSNWLVPR